MGMSSSKCVSADREREALNAEVRVCLAVYLFLAKGIGGRLIDGCDGNTFGSSLGLLFCKKKFCFKNILNKNIYYFSNDGSDYLRPSRAIDVISGRSLAVGIVGQY